MSEPQKFYTLEEAKQFLRENWEKGAPCPCCTQYVKQYKRKLNSGMAYVLIAIYNIDKTLEDDHYFEMAKVLVSKGIGGINLEYAKLAYWGLTEAQPGNDDPTKRTSGMWRITDRGRRFVEGKIAIPKHVKTFNSKFYGYSDETITIREALGEKFDYEELMNA